MCSSDLNTERVDTRVLQVIYECDPTGLPPLFVGQQLEVFIEAPSRLRATVLE